VRAQANDDLRQEQLAVQLIGVIQNCFDDAGLPLALR
jgi:phosphatidylinositol kinase/protein kinase (PI-3  family)